MPGLVLRSDLVAKARKRADMENSQKVTDQEIQDFLDEGAAMLYEKLVAARGASYYATYGTYPTSVGVEAVNLDADFFQLLGVTHNASGTYVPMRAISQSDIARRLNPSGGSAVCGPYDYRYALGGKLSSGSVVLQIFPTPTAVFTVRAAYIPVFRTATVSGQVYYDGIDGWEAWLILYAAKFCAAKESRAEDVAFLRGELAEQDARIARLAGSRDRSEPVARIRDVYEGEDCADVYTPRRWP